MHNAVSLVLGLMAVAILVAMLFFLSIALGWIS